MLEGIIKMDYMDGWLWSSNDWSTVFIVIVYLLYLLQSKTCCFMNDQTAVVKTLTLLNDFLSCTIMSSLHY